MSGLSDLTSNSGKRSSRRAGSYRYSAPPHSGGRRRGLMVLALVPILALVVLIVGIVRYFGAVPPPVVAQMPFSLRFPGQVHFRWPAGDEATIDLAGVGPVRSSGGEKPIAIASVTKVMSAYIVLKDHPLSVGESGPMLTVTPADVAAYQAELSQGDSVVAVTPGEQISELQALEAALIPSGDNIIQMLAVWDAKTTSAFVAKMNSTARQLGMSNTHYAGPSGVNPATVSTATDQVALATKAMSNPVFASIVAMASVALPGVPLQYNVNGDLGQDGIFGIKTGWVPTGGASFVFAAHIPKSSALTSGHKKVTVIGAIVGQQGGTPLASALSGGISLVKAMGQQVRTDQVVRSGQQVATLRSEYSPADPIVTTGPVTLLGWPGAIATARVELAKHLVAPLSKGEQVGTLYVDLGAEHIAVPVVAANSLSGPSFGWKVLR